jgi:hypothetical protein
LRRKKKERGAFALVAANHGPAGVKPTEAKNVDEPTVGLVPAEA